MAVGEAQGVEEAHCVSLPRGLLLAVPGRPLPLPRLLALSEAVALPEALPQVLTDAV